VEALASGSWLTQERVRRIASITGLCSLGLLVWLVATSHGTLDWKGRPLGTDFSEVWAAGWMSLHGHAADAWIWSKHFAVQKALQGPGLTEVYGWHYPPPFLLVASALALLPYLVALALWQAATLAPFTMLMQRLVPGRDTPLLTLAAPVSVICVMHGHNGFLTALLLAGGLMLLDRRPLVAGLLFGCLIYKPQLGLILPVLLLSGRHWTAILGACLSAALLVGATYLLWGWPVWQAFLTSLPLTRHVVIEQGAAGFFKIVSAFAAVRLWGGSVAAAYAVQSAVTISAMAGVAWLAFTKRVVGLRNAAVCAATVLCTPYVLDYDLTVLLPALAWLWLDGRERGWHRWDGTMMAIVWIAPLFGRAAGQLLYVPLDLISAVLVFAIAMRRSWHRHPAVDVERLPGDIAGLTAGEIDAGRADVLAAAHLAKRDP
jgi:hypothetical protein